MAIWRAIYFYRLRLPIQDNKLATRAEAPGKFVSGKWHFHLIAKPKFVAVEFTLLANFSICRASIPMLRTLGFCLVKCLSGFYLLHKFWSDSSDMLRSGSDTLGWICLRYWLRQMLNGWRGLPDDMGFEGNREMFCRIWWRSRSCNTLALEWMMESLFKSARASFG